MDRPSLVSTMVSVPTHQLPEGKDSVLLSNQSAVTYITMTGTFTTKIVVENYRILLL